MDKVVDFINKFKFIHKKELEDTFTSGNCYYFALILKDHFDGEIYYLPIENHFICKVESNYYDITGIASMNEKPYKWSEYKNLDSRHYNRIVRDCIDFKTRKVKQ